MSATVLNCLFRGLAETIAAWLRGDLAIAREELIDRSTDLFVVVAEHVLSIS